MTNQKEEQEITSLDTFSNLIDFLKLHISEYQNILKRIAFAVLTDIKGCGKNNILFS